MNLMEQKAAWLKNPDIRPYVFVREENQIHQPGSRHHLNWFSQKPILVDPLSVSSLPFADRIYSIEERAFGPSNMAMPRWVFYDCGVIPGFVAGFAARPSALTPAMRKALDPSLFPASTTTVKTSKVLTEVKSIDEMEWVPLSLFIIIPTMHKGEWVAHNLCSVNSLVEKEDQLYGLGFLSKAFGLWYANVEQCTGMTQWGSPALKLHSNYGHLEVIGAYAPVHSHAKTVTYRVEVNTNCWEKFFTKELDLSFLENYGPTEDVIDPTSEDSMFSFQQKIEKHQGPFYLSAGEIADKKLDEKLKIYKQKNSF